MTPTPDVRTADVVVVGAGLAGLKAANMLHDAGLAVLVLEARDRVGGRLHTVEADGAAFEVGGQWIAPHQSAIQSTIQELGLSLFARYRQGDDVYLDPEGGAHRFRGHDLPFADSEELYAAIARLQVLADELDPNAPWEHPRARRLDAMTFEQWLQREVPNDRVRDFLRFLVADAVITKPADSFSVLQAGWLLASADGDVENLFDADRVLDSRVRGGAQQIAVRLARRLEDRVVLEAPVTACRWSPAGVQMEAARGRFEATHAVVAVPPNLISTIRFSPPLPASRAAAAATQFQGIVNKVQAAYSEPFWRGQGLSGTGVGPGQLVAEVYDNTPEDGTPGVIVGFASGDAARAAAAMSPDERRAAVLATFARYLGRPALGPTHYVERDWSQEEWTRGGYSTSFPVGMLSRLGRAMRTPTGPLRWASSDIAGTGYMHMDGAVRSGELAAESILADHGGPLARADRPLV